MAQVEPSLCYGKYNNSVHNHIFNTIHNIRTYSGKVSVRPIKKFTFHSYGTVSLFNYVRARYAGQLTYL